RQGRPVRYRLIAVSSFIALCGCAPQQSGVYREGQAYPTEQGVVCAVKAGNRQNYWNLRAAQLDGAMVMFQGECPAEPNSEGFMGCRAAGGSGDFALAAAGAAGVGRAAVRHPEL